MHLFVSMKIVLRENKRNSFQGDAAISSSGIFLKIDLTVGLIHWKILLKGFNFSRLHATNR